jgi:hypothetical protein
MTVEMLRAFFGWCTLLNWATMFIALPFLTLGRGWTYRLHGKIFGLAEEEVPKIVYLVMVGYKTAIVLFCLVPYLVLRIIA